MNQKLVHAVFDIGKTNKKLALFDVHGNIAWRTSTSFPTMEDKDGFPSDNLEAIENWILSTMRRVIQEDQWKVVSINFSGYGASIVYLDNEGNRLPIFTNYLKPYPEKLTKTFFDKYGPKEKFCRETASPYLGMLNSGLQIYWLKHTYPQIYSKVSYVLHFPQYLSYLFTGIPLAEYTSIGCHTGMWAYADNDYHRWIDEEGIRPLLPPLKPSDTWIDTAFEGIPVRIGTGLHDTSASLLPYLRSEEKPFILLSTGTWALSVNPFSTDELSQDDLQNDCLNFLRIDGEVVRTARLFLGREHEIQVDQLSEYYQVNKQDIMNLEWDPAALEKSRKVAAFPFEFKHLKPTSQDIDQLNGESCPDDYTLAYYQLMDHLVPLQLKAIRRAEGSQSIPRLIIDGGFKHNPIFIEMLRLGLPEWDIRASGITGGSARGVLELV